jgi:hypothetical protein
VTPYTEYNVLTLTTYILRQNETSLRALPTNYCFCHLIGRFFVHSERETHSSRTVTEHTLSKKSRSIKNHPLRDPPKPSLGIAIEVPRCQATSNGQG